MKPRDPLQSLATRSTLVSDLQRLVRMMLRIAAGSTAHLQVRNVICKKGLKSLFCEIVSAFMTKVIV